MPYYDLNKYIYIYIPSFFKVLFPISACFLVIFSVKLVKFSCFLRTNRLISIVLTSAPHLIRFSASPQPLALSSHRVASMLQTPPSILKRSFIIYRDVTDSLNTIFLPFLFFFFPPERADRLTALNQRCGIQSGSGG